MPSQRDGTTLEHTVIRPAAVRRHALLGIARMSRFPGNKKSQLWDAKPAIRAFRDCRHWRDDARAPTKAGLDRGRDEGWVRLRHARSSHAAAAAASLHDQP